LTGVSGNSRVERFARQRLITWRARFRTMATAAMLKVWKLVVRRPVARLYHYDLIFRTGNFDTMHWAGTQIWQNPLDLWSLQETLSEVRPALLIETGTNKGGSARFYANLMDVLGTGRVLTIDIVQIHNLDHERIECLHGSSTDPATIAEVRKRVEATDGPVFVILDGNHDRDFVAEELELYAPFVTPGSYLMSQDGIIDRFPMFRNTRPGPLESNRAFLERHPEFVYDKERNEKFGLTHHPLGWMRRRAE
jgi:cephalosporin hydroxylase